MKRAIKQQKFVHIPYFLTFVSALVIGSLLTVYIVKVSASGGETVKTRVCLKNALLSGMNSRIIGSNESCSKGEVLLDLGIAAVNDLEVVTAQSEIPVQNSNGVFTTVDATATCPNNKRAISGGATVTDVATGQLRSDPIGISNSFPVGSPPRAWRATAFRVLQGSATNDNFNWRLTTYAVCANGGFIHKQK